MLRAISSASPGTKRINRQECRTGRLTIPRCPFVRLNISYSTTDRCTLQEQIPDEIVSYTPSHLSSCPMQRTRTVMGSWPLCNRQRRCHSVTCRLIRRRHATGAAAPSQTQALVSPAAHTASLPCFVRLASARRGPYISSRRGTYQCIDHRPEAAKNTAECGSNHSKKSEDGRVLVGEEDEEDGPPAAGQRGRSGGRAVAADAAGAHGVPVAVMERVCVRHIQGAGRRRRRRWR